MGILLRHIVNINNMYSVYILCICDNYYERKKYFNFAHNFAYPEIRNGSMKKKSLPVCQHCTEKLLILHVPEVVTHFT